MKTPPCSLEPLEARIAPATFTVTTTADAGAGSLRQAILDANATTEADTIAFAIPGGAVVNTIALATPLPIITRPLVIDGESVIGERSGDPPVIELSGAGLPAGAAGLTLATDDSEIAALAINRFPGPGIVLAGSRNSVEACFIGTNAAGDGAAGNGVGIWIDGSDNVIGHPRGFAPNTISGNLEAGIHIASGTGNVVVGNRIGIGYGFGVPDFIPNRSGVFIAAAATDNLIGTSEVENAIAGNAGPGITLESATGRNRIQTAFIFSNGGPGIDLFGDGPTLNGSTGTHVNFPVLTDALYGGGIALFRGALTAAPLNTYEVRVFTVRADDPTQGRGGGGGSLFTETVTTDATGVARFQWSVPTFPQIGSFISATATDASGNTSEFSTPQVLADALRVPAIAADGRRATFTDADGDRVTVAVSKGRLQPTHFTLAPTGPGTGSHLVSLDLRSPEFTGANLTILADPTVLGGDGRVEVGRLAGFELGVVRVDGDLISIAASTRNSRRPALGSLEVQSLGATSDVLVLVENSSFYGNVGRIAIAGSVQGTELHFQGHLGSLQISRDVGTESDVSIFVTERLGQARIGGDFGGLGGAEISARSIGKLGIGGAVRGSSGKTAIDAGSGGIGRLSIGGSLLGSNTASLTPITGNPGGIVSDGAIGALTIVGDVVGGALAQSGSIQAPSIGVLRIGGSVHGGDGYLSGRIFAGTAGTVSIGGSLFGGDGFGSGGLLLDSVRHSLHIGGSLAGGDGERSGTVGADTLRSVRIDGSATPGAGRFSGSILSAGRIGAVAIGGSLHSTLATDLAIGSVTVRGDLTGMIGAAAVDFFQIPVPGLSIGRVTVGGDFSGAILAGWHYRDGWVHSVVSIGSVVIGGDVTSGRISAGVSPGPNGQYADADDVVLAPDSAAVTSHIRSILVRGQVGHPDPASHYGFTAEAIGALRVGNTALRLTAGKDQIDLGPLANVSLREA